jgi:Right handed beta helix region
MTITPGGYLALVGTSLHRAAWLFAAVATLVLWSSLAAPAKAIPGCDKYAGPTGNDLSPGTEAMPYRSVKALVGGLGPGQTGCLRAGNYPGPDNAAAVPTAIYLDAPNSTLRSYPGEQASVDARLEVTGTGAKVTELTLDSATLNPTVTPFKLVGDGSSLSNSNVTGNDRIGTCVQIGTGTTQSSGVVIERNRLTHCGADDGGENKWDHNIYVARSLGAIIRWNVLRDNAGGWGVHLYPDADRTLIEHNMIDSDHGGVVFAGNGTGAKSDDNEVRFNSLTYPDAGGSLPRYNLEGSWSGGPVGVGNTAHDNCIHSSGAGSPSGIQDPPSGFTATNNYVFTGGAAADQLVDGYRLWAQNPCAVPAEALVGPHPSG